MTEAMRRTGHRLREVHGRDRVALAVIVAVFALAPFVAAGQALASGWQPTGDVAIITLRAHDVGGSDTPLVGQPTTSEELTGTPANHPGPIEFWVLAPSLKVLGARAGAPLAIAAVNAAAIAAALLLAHRRGAMVLTALVAVSVAGLVQALNIGSLYDPFNSELATYPMLVLMLAAWSLMVGDLRVAPIFAVAAAVVSQVHVAGAAFVGPVLAMVAISLATSWRSHRGTVRKERAYLLGALGIFVLCWLPPLLHELGGNRSNVTALWEAATIDRPRVGLSFVLERVATAVAPIPIFLRPTGRFGFLVDVSAVQVYAASLIIAACIVSSRLAKPPFGRNHPGLLSLVTLCTAAFSALAASGQPPLAALRADGTRWLWVLSLLIWVSATWSGWHLLSERAQTSGRRWAGPVAAVATVGVLVASLAGASLGDQRDGDLMEPTAVLADAVIEAVPEGTYRLQFEGGPALVSVGPGIAYRLEAAGSSVRLDDNQFTRGYGSDRTDAGPVDGELRITSDGASDAQPGEVLVAETQIDPNDPGSLTIKVFAAL